MAARTLIRPRDDPQYWPGRIATQAIWFMYHAKEPNRALNISDAYDKAYAHFGYRRD